MPSRIRASLSLAGPKLTLAGLALLLPRCGGQNVSEVAVDGGGGRDATLDGTGGGVSPVEGDAASFATLVDAAAGTPSCEGGWECKVDTSCSANSPTVLTGKVFDPAGLNPLYNALVFIPNDPASLPPITPGSPDCSPFSIGSYVNAALTNDQGEFTLPDVPVGSGVPLTVQVGKWRRTVTLDIPQSCGKNTVADGTLRLPRSRSEGDMPRMALLTGGADNLACLIQGIGVDASEFGPPGSGASVEVYQGVGGAGLADAGAGDCTGPGCPLWSAAANLAAYDAALLGCEGGENLQTKPPAAMQVMHDWLIGGGKLFGVHQQNTWFAQGPSDFQAVATWVDGSASGATGPFEINTGDLAGQRFDLWAQANGAADADGGLSLVPQDVATSVSAVGSSALAWIYDESTAGVVDGSAFPGNVKALTVSFPRSTPDAGPQATGSTCGRAVLTDIHPGGTTPLSPVPSACTSTGLSAEEKALEYFFFDEFGPIYLAPTCACPPPPPPGGH